MTPQTEWQTGNIDFVEQGTTGVYSYRQYEEGWIVQGLGMRSENAFTVVVSACHVQFEGLYMEACPAKSDTVRVTYNCTRENKDMMVEAAQKAFSCMDDMQKEMKDVASVVAAYALDVRNDITEDERQMLKSLCR